MTAIFDSVEIRFVYLHQVLRQCTRFVGTNHGDSSHGFTGVHFSYQVVGREHAAHIQSQTERYTHR